MDFLELSSKAKDEDEDEGDRASGPGGWV